MNDVITKIKMNQEENPDFWDIPMKNRFYRLVNTKNDKSPPDSSIILELIVTSDISELINKYIINLLCDNYIHSIFLICM